MPNSKPQGHSQILTITTRQNPNNDIFDVQIKNRKRAPNLKNLPMDTTNPNKTVPDNSTQTDPDSKKGRGLNALKVEKHAELFTAIVQLPTPEYLQNLMRVFNEKFLAEISKKDLGPILELFQNRDRATAKKGQSFIR